MRCDTGQPVGNARIELDYWGTFSDQQEHGDSTSNENGIFSVSANDPPGSETDDNATLAVSAKGYNRVKRAVHHSYTDEQSVCLEPSAPGP